MPNFPIKADEYGAQNGWFNFPWSFDPVWLKRCDAFEACAETPPEKSKEE